MGATTELENKWNEILKECSKQLTIQLVKYHQSRIVQSEQMAETIITNASHQLLPKYITNVPDIPNMIEYAIEEFLCEVSLLNIKNQPNVLTHHHSNNHYQNTKKEH